jgi:hypothetical protein
MNQTPFLPLREKQPSQSLDPNVAQLNPKTAPGRNFDR